MSMRSLLRCLVLAAFAALPQAASATVAFANIFSNDMILQREAPVHIWGTASAGESVTVTFGSLSGSAVADSGGAWSLYLPAMAANATGQDLVAVGAGNTVTKTNVVVGDIWLFSGQSNTEYPLWDGGYTEYCLPNGGADAAAANYPNIRMLHVHHSAKATPVADLPSGTTWKVMTPANVTGGWDGATGISGLGFYMARDIYRSLTVPVGLLEAAYGGSPAEAFISRESLSAEPLLAAAVPSPAQTPDGANPNYMGSGLYNGEIAPLTNFTIKGVVWDQGEANSSPSTYSGAASQLGSGVYSTLFTVLIKDWRARWNSQLPFMWVQMQNMTVVDHTLNSGAGGIPDWANDCTPQNPVGMADVRWGQFMALGLTNTGMNVSVDLNINAYALDNASNPHNPWHPSNKEDFANRLLPWLKRMVYSLGTGTFRAPNYVGYAAEGAGIRVTFDAPLGTTDTASPRGFMVGDGSTWVWADSAAIGGGAQSNSVLVSAASMASPTKVRYAWSNNPVSESCTASVRANLSDASGVWPVSPFQTIDLPVAGVSGNGVAIMDNDLNPTTADGRDFGSVDMTEHMDRTFTITNTGAATLALSGGAGNYVRIGGVNGGDLTVVSQPASTVAPGGSTTFTVRFQPLGVGARSAVIQVPSNDIIRTPFLVTVKGNGTSSITPSPTPNWTATATPTVTMTPTWGYTPGGVCGHSETAAYGFETGAQGFTAQAATGSTMGAAATSTSYYCNGNQALCSQVTLAHAGNAAQFYFLYQPSTDIDLSGQILSVLVYTPPSMSDGATSAKLYIKSRYGSNTYVWSNGADFAIPSAGGWTKISFNLANAPSYQTGATNTAQVQEIGLAFWSPAAQPDGTYTVCIDSFDTVPANATATITPTRTPGSPATTPVYTPGGLCGNAESAWLGFESDTGSFAAFTDSAAYATIGTASMNNPYSCNGSFSLCSTVTVLDASASFGFKRVATVDLTGMKLSALLYVPAGFSTGSTTAKLYIKNASWAWSEGPAVTLPTAPGWVRLEYDLSSASSATTVGVLEIGLQVVQPNTGTFPLCIDSFGKALANATPTSTRTVSATSTVSPVCSPTASPTASPVYSPTASPTASPVYSPTASPTASPSFTRSPTHTASPAVTPSRTGTPTTQPTSVPFTDHRINRVVLVPNPVRGGRLDLRVKMEGDADSVRWKLYSAGLACVRSGEYGPLAAGWNSVPLTAEVLRGLPSGAYYIKLQSVNKGAVHAHTVIEHVILLP